ncbi:ricin-type beta-trefoil lectin domain protein [Streptomyces albidoflavus]
MRQDQCLLSDALRIGGESMATVGQDGLNQTAEKLREAANREYWNSTPLSAAFASDMKTADEAVKALDATVGSWKSPVSGLETPGDFTETEFHWPPGTSNDGREDFFEQTGLKQWHANWYLSDEGSLYEDPTPGADSATRAALKALGDPLYGTPPDSGLPTEEWNRAYAEHQAYKQLTEATPSADDVRIFLESGGFPRTAPASDSAEFRIAVENLKSRYAACAWRDPIDPNGAHAQVAATAGAEWQQEISSQADSRNAILNINKNSSDLLVAASKRTGEMLGHAWVADHLVRWQDYWSAGGVGTLQNKPHAVQIPAAPGKCLDTETEAARNGNPVVVRICSGKSNQKWVVEGGGSNLHLRNLATQKCLDVQNNNPANGTPLAIWTCNESPAQTWSFNVRASSALKSVGTGKCLDLGTIGIGRNALLNTCSGAVNQQLKITPTGDPAQPAPLLPPAAQFTKAQQGLTAARTAAMTALKDLEDYAEFARLNAHFSSQAEERAHATADANGVPRGRGLLVGQQKAQVTEGIEAALAALAKAGATAEAATRATAADSETIAQRAVAQASQSKAEFRKEAAARAEWQAQASMESAKLHRDNAKKHRETAELKLQETLEAEADAKAAAADAHAKRLDAEAEEKTAKAEKEKAAAKQAEAAEHRENAEGLKTESENAKKEAEKSADTAAEKRSDAEKARDNAKAKRDDAWEAEQKANSARAKADAKESYANSLEAGEAADDARAAANEADEQATNAEKAAREARTEADLATQAAADADAAATRAEAAADRARADAEEANAAKLRADAAVRKATSSAADAIKAAESAGKEAGLAVQAADSAEQHAKDAKGEADAARKETRTAQVAAAKATGLAYTTALATADAHRAAAKVATPANEAIQLGSPYINTDYAAPLVVLTGQRAKTIAEQQAAVADAHAKNAKEEASLAHALADQAAADTKAAYQSAANAAAYAATARSYAGEALEHAVHAAKAATKATDSLARTVEYGKKAAEDAAAADAAAGRADGHAKSARESADEAALDAEAARKAATQAEEAAQDARAAANRADADAKAAEEAAKDAQKHAESAEDAAERAENAAKINQLREGTVPDEIGTSINGVYYVVEKVHKVGEPKVIKKSEGCEGWWDKLFYYGDCTITQQIGYKADLDLYLCTTEVWDNKCFSDETLYLGEHKTGTLYTEVTHTITMEEYQKGIDPVDILFGSWVRCIQKLTPGGESGSWSDCAWATVDVAALFAGKILRPIADAVTALDGAAKTGIGFIDAWKALSALRISDAAVAGIASKMAEKYYSACKKLSRSIPISTLGVIGKPVPEYSCDGIVPYNSTDLGRMAYKARVEAGFGIFGGRNVAVARVPGWDDPKTGDLVVGFSQGNGFHAEDHVLEQLTKKDISPKKITELYSERQPCAACGPNLENHLSPGTEITWSVQWGSDLEMNSAFTELLGKLIQQQ